ncbi:MAG: glycosyltransferase [Cyanobacteriota bacterium]|nr:glycosyltransferase [Cyanobacteriota bacterium]
MKRSAQPLISVIIPVLNSREVIETAINSLAVQTSRGFEVILSDGGSVDGTVEYALKTLASHCIEASAIVAKGSSIYGAINHAVRLARGQWVYVLGSDDTLYTPTVFDEVSRRLAVTTADVVYGDAWFEANGGFVYGGPFWLNRLAALNICHQAIFYRASRIAQVALTYDEKYELLADWDYNLKLFSCCRFEHMPLLISRFSCTGRSSTRTDEAFEADRYANIIKYFGWRAYFLLSPDWLSRGVALRPSRLNAIGLAMNRLVYKISRTVSPERQSPNLRQLVFAGSQLPLNLHPQGTQSQRPPKPMGACDAPEADRHSA